MRASNLSLVIVTSYCVLWANGARAQGASKESAGQGRGPFDIGITPLPLTLGPPYTITWSGCFSPDCTVFDASLVEVDVTTVNGSPDQVTTTSVLEVVQRMYSDRQ
jgi:hypothetical protein